MIGSIYFIYVNICTSCDVRAKWNQIKLWPWFLCFFLILIKKITNVSHIKMFEDNVKNKSFIVIQLFIIKYKVWLGLVSAVRLLFVPRLFAVCHSLFVLSFVSPLLSNKAKNNKTRVLIYFFVCRLKVVACFASRNSGDIIVYVSNATRGHIVKG